VKSRAGGFIEASLLFGLALAIFLDTRAYPASLVPDAPGPAFFPRLLALGLGVCAGVLGGRAWRSGPEDEGPAAASARVVAPAGPAVTDRGGVAVGAAGRVAVAVGAIAGFILLAPRVGTFVVLPALLAALMVLLGERKPRSLIGVPLLFTAFVYLVFFRLLGVELPTAW